MYKRVVINSKYEYLREYLQLIPENFDSLGEVLEAQRNIIRKDNVKGISLIIKSFKRIYLPNRIRYSFFYPSKAQRAFDYGNMLLQNGFNTPTPMAYIEVKKYGLISESYFISEYLDFQPLHTVVNITSNQVSEWIPDLASFTFQLHQANINHVDYNLGNVMFKKEGNRYVFALVDNNRMKFGSVSLRNGIISLARLGLSVVDNAMIAKEYANLRQTDETMGIKLLFHYKVRGSNKNKIKDFFKSIVK